MLLVNIERCFGNIEPIFETPRITPTFSHASDTVNLSRRPAMVFAPWLG